MGRSLSGKITAAVAENGVLRALVRLHFGIGSASSATVEVRWPSGIVNTVANVAANSTLTIVESTNPTPTPTPTPAPPVITQQPRKATVTAGQTATFRVKATGTPPLSYQWRKNAMAIGGATNPTYTTPPTTLADNGALFSVVVSNNGGSTTSQDAQLRVKSIAASSAER